jgi:threonine dehydrogenase-like Zn-dependent dehydrogenase
MLLRNRRNSSTGTRGHHRLYDHPELTFYSIGPDFSFDASGLEVTLNTGLKALRKGGVHYNIALWGKKVRLHNVIPSISNKKFSLR